MKKVVMLFALIGLFVGLNSIVNVNLSFDLGGSCTTEGTGYSYDNDVNMGISPSIEYYLQNQQNKSISYGAGLEFQFPRGLSGDDIDEDATFHFMPVYLAGKYQFTQVQYKPEINVQLGYNFLMGSDEFKGNSDLSGGMYFGIGTTVAYEKYLLGLMYKANYGGKDNSAGDADFSYSHIALSIGYAFELPNEVKSTSKKPTGKKK